MSDCEPRERQETPKVRIREWIALLPIFLTVRLLGVVLTHGMMAVGFHAQLYGFNVTEIPICISFLPLAHVYGVCPCWLPVASAFLTAE